MNQEANTPLQRPVQELSHATVEHVNRPHPANRTVAVTAADTAVMRSADSLILPPTLVSKSDLSRSLRELSQIDDYFHQASIRGAKDLQLPTLGRVLDSLASSNGLNMLQADDRSLLKSFLARLKTQAPVVHMSFPAEPSTQFSAKILEWFRTQVHPYIVLSIGIQPNLVAGCLLRTTNRSFDFSFRSKFEQSKEKLVKALEVPNVTQVDVAVIPEGNFTQGMEEAGQANEDVESTDHTIEQPSDQETTS